MEKRPKAPSVDIRRKYVDKRWELVAQLNEAHPEFVHVFRDAKVTNDALRDSGQEIVHKDTYEKGAEHEPLDWRGDLVARAPRADWEAARNAECEESAGDVKSLYCRPENNENWRDNSPGRRVATPKDPNNIGNIGGM
jgi:hypothetical protein